MRWSEEEYEEYKRKQYTKKVNSVVKKKSKYNARGRHDEDGRWHASQAEYDRWKELQLFEKAGVITDLVHQPVFYLTRAEIKYRADYQYSEKSGYITVEDIKGVWTSRFKVIAQLWRCYGPYTLRITGRKKGHTYIQEEITP